MSWNCSVILNSKVVVSDKAKVRFRVARELKTSCKTTQLAESTLPPVFGKEWLFDGAGHILPEDELSFSERQRAIL